MGQEQADGSRPWQPPGTGRRDGWDWTAGEPASRRLPALGVLVGLALGLIATASWKAGAAAPSIALLIGAGAVATFVALLLRRRTAESPQEERPAPEGPSPLLAQMHHDLRTPLTAMMGFSEAMLRELHGPLGHARYQEYAAHISESGGRLLRASEDALAVAAAMSALVADRQALRRDRLPAASLVREAWTASGAAPSQGVQLAMEDGGGVDVECDWQATNVALQHLLGEAINRMPPGGTVVARMTCADGAIRIEIGVLPPATSRRQPGDAYAGSGVRIMLARSLLEMQGAMLRLAAPERAEYWTARITFPAAAPAGVVRRRRPQLTAAAQVHRGGSAAAAAARASAGSRAAPPA